ncbi:uncharacterized protein LOC117153042 isoform X2 [Anabas testudineus]|uniref:uncharacterized protein LOC117153042 isoform X2 n=1 Tax=Anabas testudineus TaxID=64144 RepID=UPI00143CF999|nr:uncharacterized protein LOC117153042 isoform X2 [Anabas testudineus]
MIFRILLLINLISCVSGTFVVNVTQTSYQAEENHNITLEWTFTIRPHRSLSFIFIYCELIADDRVSVLFYLCDGVRVSESQDQQFSGRVQFDKDVLREGRIRLQLSRLRTNDSGLYLCEVRTVYGGNLARCKLNVTVADQHKPQRPTVSPPAEGPERIYLYTGLGLGLGLGLLLTAAALVTIIIHKCLNVMKKDMKENVAVAETESLSMGSSV